MNNIVGVRYIGKKERHEDSLLNTGAVWESGQIHNFHEPLARQLLRHGGTYEEASVSAAGETFMGGKTVKATREPVAYVNINGMGKEALAAFTKREFLRHIDIDDRTDEDVRAEVRRLMTTHNMDELATEALKGAEGKFPYIITVSTAEHEALVSGDLVVKLVPAEDDSATQSAPATEQEQTKMAQAQSDAAASGAPVPTLDELLGSLDEDGLIAFAKQEGVEGINKRMNADTMRSRITEALTLKAA